MGGWVGGLVGREVGGWVGGLVGETDLDPVGIALEGEQGFVQGEDGIEDISPSFGAVVV